MSVQRLAPLILSDDECAELKSLTTRRQTAQGAGSESPDRADLRGGGQNKEVAAKLGLERAR